MSKSCDDHDSFKKTDVVQNNRRWNYGLSRGRTLKAGQTQRSLRTVDYDHDLIGHDHHTETMFPYKEEENDFSTSCRVGPVHARGGKARHARAARYPAI